MKIRLTILFLAFIVCIGCGSSEEAYGPTVSTQAQPIINRVVPAAAAAGDVVTLLGFGFSYVPQYNVVSIDGNEVVATAYALVAPPVQDEIESLTFTVPAGIAVGAHTIFVIVDDNPSNTDLSITITP